MGKLNLRAVLLSATLCSSLTAGAYSVTDEGGATYNPLQMLFRLCPSHLTR